MRWVAIGFSIGAVRPPVRKLKLCGPIGPRWTKDAGEASDRPEKPGVASRLSISASTRA